MKADGPLVALESARALSDLMESGLRLYLFVATQFPSRQMNPFGSKLLSYRRARTGAHLKGIAREHRQSRGCGTLAALVIRSPHLRDDAGDYTNRHLR